MFCQKLAVRTIVAAPYERTTTICRFENAIIHTFTYAFIQDGDVDAERCIHQNCMGAEDAAVEGCFDSLESLENCDRDVLCKVGSTGILCGVCESTYYMDRLTCKVRIDSFLCHFPTF